LDKYSLHIISLEIPFPPVRGNVIGIYHRIKALHEAGISITLHAFYKNLSFPHELTKYCKTIYLYRRKPLWQFINLVYPLYVQSRRDTALVDVLLRDSSPIWFEGLHTLFHFDDARIQDRKKFIRMHNLESRYYYHLARTAPSILKKIYYQWESIRNKWLENSWLKKADGLFAISREEFNLLNSRGINTQWLPPFHPHDKLQNLTGSGDYAIYHGDLSIKENEEAAFFLADQVFAQLNYPLVIAGYGPSTRLTNKLIASKNIRLIDSPANESMNQLIQQAHIVLLPFSQTTGYKIKMIDSLALGRHIVTSQIMQVHTELDELVHYAHNTATNWIQIVDRLMTVPFTESESNARKNLFDTLLNNKLNARKIINLIHPDFSK